MGRPEGVRGGPPENGRYFLQGFFSSDQPHSLVRATRRPARSSHPEGAAAGRSGTGHVPAPSAAIRRERCPEAEAEQADQGDRRVAGMRAPMEVAEPGQALDGHAQGHEQPADQQAGRLVMADVLEPIPRLAVVEALVLDCPPALGARGTDSACSPAGSGSRSANRPPPRSRRAGVGGTRSTRTVVHRRDSQGSKSSASQTSTRSRPIRKVAGGGRRANRAWTAAANSGRFPLRRATTRRPRVPPVWRKGPVANPAVDHHGRLRTGLRGRAPRGAAGGARRQSSLSPGPEGSTSTGNVSPLPTTLRRTRRWRWPVTWWVAARTG